MSDPTSTTDRVAIALAAIDRQIERARQRQEQAQGRFESRMASDGFLAALESVQASTLEEAAEDAIWVELRDALGDAAEPDRRFEIAADFARRLASVARRSVQASSSSFMANALAVARHNAVLRVLDDLEQCVALVHAGER